MGVFRQKALVANWKMNTDRSFQTAWMASFFQALPMLKMKKVSEGMLKFVLCPPFPYLTEMVQQVCESSVTVGAQDVSDHALGAYTGQISATVLKDIGVTSVLVGHSERRLYQKETCEMVAAKAYQSLLCGITPIICVGETLEERQAGYTEIKVQTQLRTVLDKLAPHGLAGRIWVAYEPVWAIGTGHSAAPHQVQSVHASLRFLLGRYGIGNVSILYGGSLDSNNAKEIFEQKDIDGGLVGSASLKVDNFFHIAMAMESSIPERI
jgi:triosephosphate isomerase